MLVNMRKPENTNVQTIKQTQKSKKMLYHQLVVNMKIPMLTCGTQATLGEGAVDHLKSVAKLDLVLGAKLSVQHNISVKNYFFFLVFTFFFVRGLRFLLKR